MKCLRRHMCWQSKRFYWERAPGWRAAGQGNPGEQLCHVAWSLGIYGDRISYRVVFSQSFWLRVLPSGACFVQPRWMAERRILGGGRTCGVSFWPFLNPSGWWWLISSMVLTRTSCHKTTHANGYYGAWPGGAVSVSVLTLTYPCYLFLSYSFGTYIHTSQHSALWVTLICLYYIWISSTTLEGLGGYRSCCSFPPC